MSTPTQLPTPTPTAPLPSAASAALARLERGYVSDADRLSARLARLSMKASSSADFERLLCVQDELSMCRCQLAKASRLDLIKVA